MQIFFSPRICKKKLIFVISFFTSFLCFTFSIENFLVNLYRGENNLFLHFWCCNFHILDTLMLAEYSPSINPEHERVRACARTPKPEPEHHQKHRVPSEHRASMCSDQSLEDDNLKNIIKAKILFGTITHTRTLTGLLLMQATKLIFQILS